MAYPLQKAKDEIRTILKSILSITIEEIKLETPPDKKMGDFAFPCFSLAAVFKKSPQIIAEELASKLVPENWIEKIDAHNGYINFHINNIVLVEATLKRIQTQKKVYGHLPSKKSKVIIEHTSANPNGPLHVGRARNPIIGDTLVRIFRAAGYDVEAQFYLDDMGKQVAILAWGVNHLPESQIPATVVNKSDHSLVGYYQQANKMMEEDESVHQAISSIIQKSEHGDNKILTLIHKAYKPVLEGMIASLDRIHIHLDSFIPESQFVHDKSVNTVIEDLKKSGISDTEDGAYYLDMKDFGVHGRNTKFFYLRNDGTSLYATRDIAYHLWKGNQANRLINVLGEDHKLEAHQVSTALKLLQAKVLPETVFYAFVSMQGGKMSTRKGRVVYLDDLIEEIVVRAYKEVKKRRESELEESRMWQIAEMVGVGALRYNIIKVQPEKDIVFRWKDALNFEGNAMPFIQYAHARACGILSKVDQQLFRFDASLLKVQSEIDLIKHFAQLPIVINDACVGCKPHIVASYAYETAALFNQFYRDCPVLSEKNEDLQQSRLCVVEATHHVLSNVLELLGVPAPEEM
jgi:arginyl-tRNA synthetase